MSVIQRSGRSSHTSIGLSSISPMMSRGPAATKKHHEDADREKRDELHHRLDRDRRDHAVVALVHVELAGAEDDGEDGEAHRDPDGGRV